jgi:UDP-N-acetylmuramoyl-tripeptide--D-alanyl-D-alanine ligase
VSANVRSFNNEQGLPITILNAPRETEVLVLEMGMRGFGQIADLCRVARPAIGVVTSIGEAHTELVGGIEGVARAKGELIEALPPHGVAILNGDDHRVRALSSRTVAPVILYGESEGCDVRISDVAIDDRGRTRAVLTAEGDRAELTLAMQQPLLQWVWRSGSRSTRWCAAWRTPRSRLTECASSALDEA